jgi:1,4-dihydroxy-2-naphthoyl-CoA synthase
MKTFEVNVLTLEEKEKVIEHAIKPGYVSDMLIRYVRNEQREKIGVVVALGKGKIGWSICYQGDPWDEDAPPADKFDKELGLKIAIGRAERGSRKRIPDAILRTMVESYKAAELHFE